MDQGSIFATFLIVFREALEAGLIVGIILTTLAKLKQQRYVPHVIMSTILALGASVAAGFALAILTQSAQGKAEKMIEGLISLVASGILTYMVFWMTTRSYTILRLTK